MHTFLLFEDYTDCAKALDPVRLNSGINEALVLLKSLARFYDLNRRGESGWEMHTVAKFWAGHELQLSRFGLALATEFLHRALAVKGNKAEVLATRKKRFMLWRTMVEQIEDLDFPDEKPSLIGQEDFHSAFRAWLLYKDMQKETFQKWKRGEYPKHLVTNFLLPKKSSWKSVHYEAIWEYFGKPEGVWYSKLGWAETPDDMSVFYTEDRIPQAEKEKQRKKERPHYPFLKKKEVADEPHVSEEESSEV